MTLKNKIIGAIFAAYLGFVLGGTALSSYLINNFDYSRRMDNGLVVKVKNRIEREKIIPEKMVVTHGSSSLVGRDSDNNGSLDNIVFNMKSQEAIESLSPLAKPEVLTEMYKSIMESEEYLEIIRKRQKLGNPLLVYSLALGMMGLFASGGYKFSNATPEQLNHPLFHCR